MNIAIHYQTKAQDSSEQKGWIKTVKEKYKVHLSTQLPQVFRQRGSSYCSAF
ncbi:MAG: hypothetical protein ACJARQ_000948 [Oleispira sp.]|jgi:hypothetical protein